MKSLVRWSVALGLASGVIFGSVPYINNNDNMQAIALPQDQVVKALQEVPIFTLTNPKGEFVVISRKVESKTISQIGFFISKKDAEKFLDVRLKKENPKLANDIKIKPVSLADYYKLVLENSKKKDSSLIFTLVPKKEQLDSAKSLLKLNQEFQGVPLFVPKFKEANSYLTIPANSQGKDRLIPFYFEKEQAVALLDAFKKAKPEEAAKTEIQVVDLYGVIETLNSTNDPGMSKIFLFPSRESIEFIRSLQNTPKKK